eukprot:TRINITY_DN31632_c0_g1_i1.p1 TRINITY_DN31632_c0_g1~~TRINITY_DN31632_c0_g1_i1.p1  ORF type:complete len:360 (-),score=94.23 TRINITY_DN31632_c0_g1_i1:84-1163(-)
MAAWYSSSAPVQAEPGDFRRWVLGARGPGVTERLSDLVLAHRKTYRIIAAPGMEATAARMAEAEPNKFVYHPSKWDSFPDGTDNIRLGGFAGGKNELAGQNVLFLANFDSNGNTLSQLCAMVMLCESFLKTFTVLLPFYPTATMERVTEEGSIATANCTAKLLSNLPPVGVPTRVMCYDLHTLQNRFYFGNNALASLHSAFPLMIDKIQQDQSINAIAFPDDGAEKRYRHLFEKHLPGMEFIVCGKKRDPNDPTRRTITLKDGNPAGKRILIVDDICQSGGTIAVCGQKLRDQGAADVSAFCTHAVLPGTAAERFISGDRRDIFSKFYVTNSCPSVTARLPYGSVFEVLDLTPQILKDL